MLEWLFFLVGIAVGITITIFTLIVWLYYELITQEYDEHEDISDKIPLD
jgi:hypothetical protein